MEEIIDNYKTNSRTSYRDELNFAEFPLASVNDRLPKDQKTLVFKDKIFDKGINKPITRTLTISASDEYGLPTALDDEVILGLIQLTNQNNFENRKVHFTRYELIKLLGWRMETKSYNRLSESLKRWLGVTLYYDKAWWSKEEKCWVSENFHILDQVTIYEQERREQSLKNKKDDPNAGRSSFIWNQVVYDSFEAGYLKKIDMELYKSLKSSIAKRLYRFLDKRFYHKKRLTFDLQDFAFEHIGLSRNYSNSQIKRRLSQAINELEERGFLKSLNEAEMYQKQGKAEWSITFVAGVLDKKQSKTIIKEENPLILELTKRGVTKVTAEILCKEFDSKKIQEKIELFDWKISNSDKGIMKNPAGYLYKSIKEDYALPTDFETKEQKREKLEAKKLKEQEKKKQELKKAKAKKQKLNSEREILDEFWNNLSKSERISFEEEALTKAEKFLLTQYNKGKREGEGTLFRTVRQAIIDSHIKRTLHISQAA